MIEPIQYHSIISKAWKEYNPKREIASIVDVSANVSTNRVFAVTFIDGNFIWRTGKFENFKRPYYNKQWPII